MRYLPLLGELDHWQDQVRTRHPGVVPCRRGCEACCHGPFEVSIADVAVLLGAVARLDAATRRAVRARAAEQLARMREVEPAWTAPYELAALGEERFDRMSDALADLPCPLLDADGACLVYQHRPLVCRLMGLGLRNERGGVIPNACPIQHRFPGYPSLSPADFPWLAWEVGEARARRDAATRLLGGPEGEGYETTIAAALVIFERQGPKP